MPSCPLSTDCLEDVGQLSDHQTGRRVVIEVQRDVCSTCGLDQLLDGDKIVNRLVRVKGLITCTC